MTVLLLEAGDDKGDDPELSVPYEALSKQASHQMEWNDTTVPQSAACQSMDGKVFISATVISLHLIHINDLYWPVDDTALWVPGGNTPVVCKIQITSSDIL